MPDNFAAPARSAQEQFDSQAPHYDNQWNSWNEESLAWLLRHANTKPSETALDVATGAGFTAIAFAPHVAAVVGVDVSTGMLDQARSNAASEGLSNVEFRQAPAESLPFEHSTMDIITCRVAAHHFLSVERFIHECMRVLKPGGRLLIADTTVPDDQPEAAEWQNQVEIMRDSSHVRNYTPSEWTEMLRQAGFALEEIDSTGGGITIPLTDWMIKSGCSPELQRVIKDRFASAPESARREFNIRFHQGEPASFTWQRVVLEAVKPV